MRKIIFIIVMAVSAVTFTGCEWFCKKCPDCPNGPVPKPPSSTKIVNYYIAIIDTTTVRPYKYYAKFNAYSDVCPIGNGESYNLKYTPVDGVEDSITVRVYKKDTITNRTTNLVNYIEPLTWEQSSIDGILYKTCVLNALPANGAGGPPTVKAPIPIGKSGSSSDVPK